MKNSYTVTIFTVDLYDKAHYPSYVVYTGTNKKEALKEFSQYRRQCKAANGLRRVERSGERRKAVLSCNVQGVESVVARSYYKD